MNMNSLTVLAIDLSYRDTGVCVLKTNPSRTLLEKAISFKNPEMGNGFDALRSCLSGLNNLYLYISNTIRGCEPDVIIIEMPCFSQSAKSAVAIGMLWGLVSRFPNSILIEPSALKNWSNSQKGDGKEKVKEKVMSKIPLLKHQYSNDNIVDAVGIALFFLDTINDIKYETTKQQSDFRAFVLEN